MLPDGRSVALEPLAREIAARFHREYPDELERDGVAAEEWCIHDNKYLLAWAVGSLTLPKSFEPNILWLAGVLAARDYPVERLSRDLELAADVVREALPAHAVELCGRLIDGAAAVRGRADAGASGEDGRQERLRNEFVQAVLEGDPASARRAVESAAYEGVPARDLYLGVLQPALREVGELWATGRISVAQEHLATATAQVLLGALAPRLERRVNVARRVVVASVEGELHAVGGRFVADFLEADGWSVLEVGASAPVEDLVAFVTEIRPDVVALSTTLTTHLGAAGRAFSRLRTLPQRPLLAAGGNAYAGDATLAFQLGADLFAADAEALARELRNRFAP